MAKLNADDHELDEIIPHFIFFWGAAKENGYLSQWYPSPFIIEGVRYNCAEQYMMAEKARMFEDATSLVAIMAEVSPIQQKRLGRQVSGFDLDRWNNDSLRIVYDGNVAKFEHNPLLLEALLATGDRIIAEVSPHDLIWGIGLGIGHPDVRTPSRWKGENRLGRILMLVRDALG